MTQGVAARRALQQDPLVGRATSSMRSSSCSRSSTRPASCARAGGRAGNRQDTPPFRAGGSCQQRADTWFFRGRRRSSARCRFRSLCMRWTSTSGASTPTCSRPSTATIEQDCPSCRRCRRSQPVARWRSSTSGIGAIERCARYSNILRRASRSCSTTSHWADPASVELLGALLRRPPGAAVLIAVALRPRQTPDRLAAALERAHRAAIPQ